MHRHSLTLYIDCAGMSDIAKRDFEMFTMDGSNYLTWATDVEIKLDGMSLNRTIIEPEANKDERIKPNKAKVLISTSSPPKPEV